MRIVFVGGGSGGHFYPLIAVAEEVGRQALSSNLIQPKMYYFGPTKYDEKALYDAGIIFVYSSAGKMRRTGDIWSHILNLLSIIPIFFGVIKSILSLYSIFPDVIFSKGGYTSIPVVWAGRLLRIPIVIHESDATFGRANKWAKSFATYVGISYVESESALTESEKKKTSLVGVPIRQQLKRNPTEKAYEILRLDPQVPTIAVLGGSLGARYVNNNIIDALPLLLKTYQVVHIVGKANYETIKKETESFLKSTEGLKTYHPVDFLNAYNLRALYSVTDLAVSRAGSGTIFEVAEWGIPSILIPISERVSHDQKKNAYAYARAGGCVVMEEHNLNPHLLSEQINEILNNKEKKDEFSEKAKSFAKPKAAEKIAHLLTSILKSHEL